MHPTRGLLRFLACLLSFLIATESMPVPGWAAVFSAPALRTSFSSFDPSITATQALAEQSGAFHLSITAPARNPAAVIASHVPAGEAGDAMTLGDLTTLIRKKGVRFERPGGCVRSVPEEDDRYTNRLERDYINGGWELRVELQSLVKIIRAHKNLIASSPALLEQVLNMLRNAKLFHYDIFKGRWHYRESYGVGHVTGGFESRRNDYFLTPYVDSLIEELTSSSGGAGEGSSGPGRQAGPSGSSARRLNRFNGDVAGIGLGENPLVRRARKEEPYHRGSGHDDMPSGGSAGGAGGDSDRAERVRGILEANGLGDVNKLEGKTWSDLRKLGLSDQDIEFVEIELEQRKNRSSDAGRLKPDTQAPDVLPSDFLGDVKRKSADAGRILRRLKIYRVPQLERWIESVRIRDVNTMGVGTLGFLKERLAIYREAHPRQGTQPALVSVSMSPWVSLLVTDSLTLIPGPDGLTLGEALESIGIQSPVFKILRELGLVACKVDGKEMQAEETPITRSLDLTLDSDGLLRMLGQTVSSVTSTGEPALARNDPPMAKKVIPLRRQEVIAAIISDEDVKLLKPVVHDNQIRLHEPMTPWRTKTINFKENQTIETTWGLAPIEIVISNPNDVQEFLRRLKGISVFQEWVAFARDASGAGEGSSGPGRQAGPSGSSARRLNRFNGDVAGIGLGENPLVRRARKEEPSHRGSGHDDMPSGGSAGGAGDLKAALEAGNFDAITRAIASAYASQDDANQQQADLIRIFGLQLPYELNESVSTLRNNAYGRLKTIAHLIRGTPYLESEAFRSLPPHAQQHFLTSHVGFPAQGRHILASAGGAEPVTFVHVIVDPNMPGHPKVTLDVPVAGECTLANTRAAFDRLYPEYRDFMDHGVRLIDGVPPRSNEDVIEEHESLVLASSRHHMIEASEIQKVTVHLHAGLRQAAGGQEEVKLLLLWKKPTPRDVLAALVREYPAMKPLIFNENGIVQALLGVGQADQPVEDWFTPIHLGLPVQLVMLFAGGAGDDSQAELIRHRTVGYEDLTQALSIWISKGENFQEVLWPFINKNILMRNASQADKERLAADIYYLLTGFRSFVETLTEEQRLQLLTAPGVFAGIRKRHGNGQSLDETAIAREYVPDAAAADMERAEGGERSWKELDEKSFLALIRRAKEIIFSGEVEEASPIRATFQIEGNIHEVENYGQTTPLIIAPLTMSDADQARLDKISRSRLRRGTYVLIGRRSESAPSLIVKMGDMADWVDSTAHLDLPSIRHIFEYRGFVSDTMGDDVAEIIKDLLVFYYKEPIYFRSVVAEGADRIEADVRPRQGGGNTYEILITLMNKPAGGAGRDSSGPPSPSMRDRHRGRVAPVRAASGLIDEMTVEVGTFVDRLVGSGVPPRTPRMNGEPGASAGGAGDRKEHIADVPALQRLMDRVIEQNAEAGSPLRQRLEMLSLALATKGAMRKRDRDSFDEQQHEDLEFVEGSYKGRVHTALKYDEDDLIQLYVLLEIERLDRQVLNEQERFILEHQYTFQLHLGDGQRGVVVRNRLEPQIDLSYFDVSDVRRWRYSAIFRVDIPRDIPSGGSVSALGSNVVRLTIPVHRTSIGSGAANVTSSVTEGKPNAGGAAPVTFVHVILDPNTPGHPKVTLDVPVAGKCTLANAQAAFDRLYPEYRDFWDHGVRTIDGVPIDRMDDRIAKGEFLGLTGKPREMIGPREVQNVFVELPPHLRGAAGGQETVKLLLLWKEPTPRDVLAALVREYPAMKPLIFDEDGIVQALLGVGQADRPVEDWFTPIHLGLPVQLVMLFAGGAGETHEASAGTQRPEYVSVLAWLMRGSVDHLPDEVVRKWWDFLLDHFTPHEKEILKLRLGLGKDGIIPKYVKIGILLDISVESVRRIELQSLRLLRLVASRIDLDSEPPSVPNGSDEPADISTRGIHAYLEDTQNVKLRDTLWRAGIWTIGDLTQKTASELMQIRNFGKAYLKEVMRVLQELGLSLKPERAVEAAGGAGDTDVRRTSANGGHTGYHPGAGRYLDDFYERESSERYHPGSLTARNERWPGGIFPAKSRQVRTADREEVESLIEAIGAELLEVTDPLFPKELFDFVYGRIVQRAPAWAEPLDLLKHLIHPEASYETVRMTIHALVVSGSLERLYHTAFFGIPAETSPNPVLSSAGGAGTVAPVTVIIQTPDNKIKLDVPVDRRTAWAALRAMRQMCPEYLDFINRNSPHFDGGLPVLHSHWIERHKSLQLVLFPGDLADETERIGMTVHLPPELQPFASMQPEVKLTLLWKEPSFVDVLAALVREYPAMKQRLFNEEGKLYPAYRVVQDNKMIPEYLKYPLRINRDLPIHLIAIPQQRGPGVRGALPNTTSDPPSGERHHPVGTAVISAA